MHHDDHTDLFEARREFLTGLAYRMLGSLADAEDAVQDTYLKWIGTNRHAIENHAAWLTTVCTRHCVDMLRSVQRARGDYIGVWLPEPVCTHTGSTPEDAAELASSLSMAFLLVLERLAPKERAAFLLHEIFDQSYADVAATLGVKEATCRKLVSRARKNVAHADRRNVVPVERQELLLSAFRSAVKTGDTAQLAAMLSQDVTLGADGGGKVPAHPELLVGRGEVLDFIATKLRRFWKTCHCTPTVINGLRGALIHEQGSVIASVGFSWNAEHSLDKILIVRNPDKLTRVESPPRNMPLQ
ncbi:MAG: RNA polymerase sigma factor SigJ [Lautropia sp.]|nr:RNA polymerase sigma factor SigJ [Lautropia sp.]